MYHYQVKNKYMDIKNEKIWVNWKLQERDGKKTKVPYQPNGNLASSTDPSTWNIYHVVKEASSRFSGIGVVFEPSINVIGIDFDKANFTALEGFITKANTYCEYSPSKTGLHLLFRTSSPVDLGRNKKTFEDGSAIEIYTGGRYFTFTENEHPLSKELRTISSEEFIELIKTLGYPWKEQKGVSTPIKTSTALSDKEVVDRMVASQNGAKIAKLLDGDISDYNGDDSSADFALCSYLAFWTGKDKEQMRRVWLNSKLGQRKKTQERVDYQDRTIDNAVEGTNDVYVPKSWDNVKEGAEKYIMSDAKNPKPMMILENICRVLESDQMFKGKFRLNDFSHMVETCWDKDDWTNLYDNAIYDVQRLISVNYEAFRMVSKAMVTDAVMSIAYHHKVNPPRDYFSGLVWDKKPRLNSWLHEAYGVADDELHQSIGSNWLKGLVKRVMRPGCVFDEVLALESPQGWRKSTSIRELGHPWHVETTHSVDDKDFYMVIAQNIIVEFSEGEIFDKASVKRLKAEVTKTQDQFRPPYERGMLTFKRSCVFAVTTNKLELKDETGNRRWLPVELKKVADIDWIKENREQLFAEAYYRVMVMGETTHEYPTEELEELQASRMESGDNDEKLLLWYADLTKEEQEAGFPLSVPMNVVFPNIPFIDKKKEWEVANILKRTLALESKNTKINGAVLKRWKPTDKTWKIIKDIISDFKTF